MVMLVLVTPGTERAVTALAEPAATPAEMSPNDSDDAASTVMRRRKRLLDIASPLREFGIRRDDSETSWRLQQRPHRKFRAAVTAWLSILRQAAGPSPWSAVRVRRAPSGLTTW